MFLSIHGFCEYVDNETKTTKVYLKTGIKCENPRIQQNGTVYHKQFCGNADVIDPIGQGFIRPTSNLVFRLFMKQLLIFYKNDWLGTAEQGRLGGL